MIPYIAQELPDTQKEALASAQKVPLLYTNVLLRNWNAFQKLGTSAIYAPGMYHTSVNLDFRSASEDMSARKSRMSPSSYT